jgi:hypothetical protein
MTPEMLDVIRNVEVARVHEPRCACSPHVSDSDYRALLEVASDLLAEVDRLNKEAQFLSDELVEEAWR